MIYEYINVEPENCVYENKQNGKHIYFSDKNYSLREGYGPKLKLNQIAFCKEKYIGRYPVPHDTPAYNFF